MINKMKNETTMLNKMFKNKKGINDISIIAVIICIFFASALVIPFLAEEFDEPESDFNIDGISSDLTDEAETASATTAVRVFITVIKLSAWDWGDTLNLPWYIDIIYTILAIIFILVIARNIWIGGGG